MITAAVDGISGQTSISSVSTFKTHFLTLLPFSFFAGFTGERCEVNIDDCGFNLCQNGATCVDGIGSYECACPPEYTGRFCSEDVDECAVHQGICQV